MSALSPEQKEDVAPIKSPQPISRLFPSMVTLLALCAGLSAIRFALLQKWEMSVTFILIAAFIDGIDGRLARLLKATSTFGAQLDSLADFVNFGVAPALLLYLWTVQGVPVRGLGWAFVLLYCVCCAIRLARFNTNLDDDERPDWADKFFSGIPSPAGGLLVLVPMMLNFKFGAKFYSPEWIGIYMVAVGVLMASRIPMFSGKKMVIPKAYTSLTLVGAGSCIVALLIDPWLTIPVLSGLYLLSMPLSVISFYRMKNASLEEADILYRSRHDSENRL